MAIKVRDMHTVSFCRAGIFDKKTLFQINENSIIYNVLYYTPYSTILNRHTERQCIHLNFAPAFGRVGELGFYTLNPSHFVITLVKIC